MQALAEIVVFLDDIAQADDDDMANDIAADGVDVCVGDAWWSLTVDSVGWHAHPVHRDRDGFIALDGTDGEGLRICGADATPVDVVTHLRGADRADRHRPPVRASRSEG
jgi:hypothetical protein